MAVTKRELKALLRKHRGGATESELDTLYRLVSSARDHSEVDFALERVNTALDASGIEAIDSSTDRDCHEPVRVDWYHAYIVALYVNVGETYSETLLYDTEAHEFFVTSWGSWFEAWEAEHPPRVSREALQRTEEEGRKWAEEVTQHLLVDDVLTPEDWPEDYFDGKEANREAVPIVSWLIREEGWSEFWRKDLTEKLLDAASNHYYEIREDSIEEGIQPEYKDVQRWSEEAKGQRRLFRRIR